MDVRIRNVVANEKREVCHARSPYWDMGLGQRDPEKYGPEACGKPAEFKLIMFAGGHMLKFNFVCGECLSAVIDGLKEEAA